MAIVYYGLQSYRARIVCTEPWIDSRTALQRVSLHLFLRGCVVKVQRRETAGRCKREFKFFSDLSYGRICVACAQSTSSLTQRNAGNNNKLYYLRVTELI